jgi:hypothetical protein
LAAGLGASRRRVQDWEAGVKHPSPERLQALINVLLEAGGLSVGREAEEAEALWAAVEGDAARMRTPFDRAAGCWVSACRLVAVLGMGGVGKTKLAEEVAPSFERVYWRSLRDDLPTSDWLAGAIAFLSDQPLVPPQSRGAVGAWGPERRRGALLPAGRPGSGRGAGAVGPQNNWLAPASSGLS